MKKNDKNILVLIDAHAVLHRAYHALPSFTSPSGNPTGALYGFTLLLLKMITELSPTHIAACYDLPGKTFRHAAFDGYKAKRPKLDSELAVQIDESRKILGAFGIPIYAHEGFEADDMLGTIVAQLPDQRIIIASGDMDTMQLIDGERVRVYTLKKGLNDTILYDEDAVRKRFGFAPALLTDYKGLRGDPSDNIPGVPGVGAKTATEIIKKFGTIEELYKKLSKAKDVKPRVKTLLEENEEQARFSKGLAEIRRDAPITFGLDGSEWRKGFDIKKVEKLFGTLGFRTLFNRTLKIVGVEVEKDGMNSLQEPKDVDNKAFLEARIALWLTDSRYNNASEDDILGATRAKTIGEAVEILRKLVADDGLDGWMRDVELPLHNVLDEMTRHGVLIDITYMEKLSKKYHAKLSSLKNKILDMAGVEFNIDSPKQLGEILFETLGIPTTGLRRTRTGAYSTNAEQLNKLSGVHPIIECIQSYRELAKLLSTYIDAFPKLVGKDARIHASFDQTGTVTGRLSSSDPNVQNIPIKSKLGRAIRNAFIAPKGKVLVASDYSQIELRLAAIMSGDKKLQQFFKDGHDVHSAVASEVFGVPMDEITYEQRRRAKVINFGILYGMGVNALQKSLGATRAEAQKFLQDYFQRFSGIAKYIEETQKRTAQAGYTETIFGRKRYFPEIKSRLPHIRASAERMAINAPIQGSQADIIKTAMVRIDSILKAKKFDKEVHLILQIHDELVYEVDKGLVGDIVPIIKGEMEGVYKASVPIIADVETGRNLGVLKPFKF